MNRKYSVKHAKIREKPKEMPMNALITIFMTAIFISALIPLCMLIVYLVGLMNIFF